MDKVRMSASDSEAQIRRFRVSEIERDVRPKFTGTAPAPAPAPEPDGPDRTSPILQPRICDRTRTQMRLLLILLAAVAARANSPAAATFPPSPSVPGEGNSVSGILESLQDCMYQQLWKPAKEKHFAVVRMAVAFWYWLFKARAVPPPGLPVRPPTGHAVLDALDVAGDTEGLYASHGGEDVNFRMKHDADGWLTDFDVSSDSGIMYANLSLLSTGPRVHFKTDSPVLAELSYALGTSHKMSADHSHGLSLLHMIALSTQPDYAGAGDQHGRSLYTWQCGLVPHVDKCGSYDDQHSCQEGGRPLPSCSGGYCQGMCGPACHCCWTWVCGDCCCNNLCLWHDDQFRHGILIGTLRIVTAIYFMSKLGCNAASPAYGEDAECTARYGVVQNSSQALLL